MASSVRQTFHSDNAPANAGDIAGNRFVAVSNSATAAGNAIWVVCSIACAVGNVITGVKDLNAGNTYTKLDQIDDNPNGLSLASYYCPNAAAIPAGDKGSATGGSTTTLVDSTKTWTTNQWQGLKVMDLNAGGATATVTSNTATTLTFGAGSINPSAGHRYAVGGWVEIDVSGNDDYNNATVREIQGVTTTPLLGHNMTETAVSAGTANIPTGTAALGSSPCIIVSHGVNGVAAGSSPFEPSADTGGGNTDDGTCWVSDSGPFARMQHRNVANPGTAGAFFSAVHADTFTGVMVAFLDTAPPPPAMEIIGHRNQMFVDETLTLI